MVKSRCIVRTAFGKSRLSMTRKRPVKTAVASMRSLARRLGKLWRLRRLGLKRILFKRKPAKTTPPRKKQILLKRKINN